MPKVTEQYRVAKRDEILTAAMHVFHRSGFRAASMSDIIAQSGLSSGAIYGHFASKADLVLAAAARVIDARIEDVERFSLLDPLQPPARLLPILMGGLKHDLGRPEMLLQLWGEAVSEPAIHELAKSVFLRIRKSYAAYISLWHQHEHGRGKAEADVIAEEQVEYFMSMTQGYVVQSALIPGFDGARFLTNAAKYLPE